MIFFNGKKESFIKRFFDNKRVVCVYCNKTFVLFSLPILFWLFFNEIFKKTEFEEKNIEPSKKSQKRYFKHHFSQKNANK